MEEQKNTQEVFPTFLYGYPGGSPCQTLNIVNTDPDIVTVARNSIVFRNCLDFMKMKDM